jgi:hypothetical protein
VRERDRESDFDRGEMLRRGEREYDGERERERERERSAGRADGGVCDRLLDRPREGGRDPMFRRRYESRNTNGTK